MNALLVWCFVWSIGANLVDASRDKFCEFCRTQFVPLVSARFSPLLGDLYGSYVDLASPVKAIEPWSNLMPTFKYDANESFFSILVPTVDTTR